MASNPDAWHDSAPRSSGVQYDVQELLVQLPDAAAVSARVELGTEITHAVDHPRGSAIPPHCERRSGQPAGSPVAGDLGLVDRIHPRPHRLVGVACAFGDLLGPAERVVRRLGILTTRLAVASTSAIHTSRPVAPAQRAVAGRTPAR